MLKNNKSLIYLKQQLHIQPFEISGVVKKNETGLSFLKTKNKIKYFIPIKYSKHVLNGDYILAHLYTLKNKNFIKPIKLIKSYLNIFIGQIKKIGNCFFIIPNYPLIKELIQYFPNKKIEYSAKNGDWIIAKIIDHALENKKVFTAKFIKFISEKKNNMTPWKVILSHYNINYNNLHDENNEVYFDNSTKRKDLTNLEFITIDNETTQDIDDAIFIKKKNDIFILTVAITDPTAYIKPGSQLDILASQRLFTNYLPGLVIPMLPTKFSEDIFSLHPNCKKPVLACTIMIDKNGNIINKVNFFLAWIKSQAKLTYENIYQWIKKKIYFSKNFKIIHQINLLHELYEKRILWRKKNSLILLDTPEYKFHFSSDKIVKTISINYRNIAHKIIEEIMIIANISAAKFLSDHLGFGIYNIHLGFSKKNIKHIYSILKKNNIKIKIFELNTLNGFRKLKRLLYDHPNQYINNRIRKYQSCGTMSLFPQPHFTLSISKYLTWTSPIRKYSDIINHRLLKNIILGYKIKKPNCNIVSNIINCKIMHRSIKNKIEHWLYVNFLKKNYRQNQILQSEIIDINPFGIRAKILSIGANVFIPIHLIHKNKKEIICDQINGFLYIKGKALYQVSNKISIKLINIQLNTRNIIAKPV